MSSPAIRPDQTRQLGQGFGEHNEFYLWMDERNKGLMNPPTSSQLAILQDWLQTGRESEQVKHILAFVITDVLIDMDIPVLAKFKLPEHLHALFSNERYFDRLDPRFILSLRNRSPGLHAGQLETMLRQPMTQDERILFAYLIPALIDVMDIGDRQFASYEIAQRLHPDKFKVLFDPDYFKVKVDHGAWERETNRAWERETNGRTVRFLPKGIMTAQFRGHVWEHDHTHAHIGDEREYVILPMKEKLVGEIHTVFRRSVEKQGKEYKQFMAVGLPLVIGAHNKGYEILLGEDRFPVDFYELFLSKFKPDEALYHSWGSLISKTPAFIDGLRFSLSTEAIEVSETQFIRLNEIFGTMVPLDPTKTLDPIDRRAYRRITL